MFCLSGKLRPGQVFDASYIDKNDYWLISELDAVKERVKNSR